MYINDTITALATPTGSGALHIIRVSGEDAIEQVAKIFQPAKKLLKAKSHSLIYGKIISDNKLLDEVLCSVFRSPNSFTGENSVEISCHGSMFVANSILTALQKNIRLANPGEFTLRAYLNSRIDLTRAEAVNDMIQAKTKKSQTLAINQLDGSLFKRISLLLDKISHFRIQLELEIDFLDDDVPELDLDKLRHNLLELKSELEALASSGKQGRIIREGLKVSLIGKPNVGKSSIFNKLLESERAIVTPIPGTTRDYLEEVIALEGYLIRVYDTAGIRETQDTIEILGIERSREIIEDSDFVLYITDGTDSLDDYEAFVVGIDSDKIIKVLNKTDILSPEIINS
ncbi:MAG: tRNA uridine-5-carboxymethylaminomethyl(34) synthesis GTPase MnmE, partial [Candidatus Cloacimonadales bacterium]